MPVGSFGGVEGGSTSSIYRSAEAEASVLEAYRSILDRWSVAYSHTDVPTRYGSVHVLISGPDDGPAVLLFHAASMSATSWAPNVGALVEAGLRIFAMDHIGEAGMSVLDSVDSFPKTPEQIGGLYTEVADALGVGSAFTIGASAGGHAAMRFALSNPGRVRASVLLGPMGIRPLGPRAVWKMMMASMFPSDGRIERTAKWALGESPAVADPYGSWFATVLGAVSSPPRVGRPVALTREELGSLGMPVLLVLGDQDNLVGNARRAAHRARSIRDLRVEVLPSSHLIGVEQADAANRLITGFLTDKEV